MQRTRRIMFIMRAVLGLSALALASAAPKPNIVFFMADGALKTSSFIPHSIQHVLCVLTIHHT